MQKKKKKMTLNVNSKIAIKELAPIWKIIGNDVLYNFSQHSSKWNGMLSIVIY